MMGTGLRWDDLLPHHRKYVYIGLILAFLFIVYRGYCYMQYPPQISIEYNDTGMMFIQKEEYANALNRFVSVNSSALYESDKSLASRLYGRIARNSFSFLAL